MDSLRYIEVKTDHLPSFWQLSIINPLFSEGRYYHAAVTMPTNKIIIIGGYNSSKYTGEIVKGKFDM